MTHPRTFIYWIEIALSHFCCIKYNLSSVSVCKLKGKVPQFWYFHVNIMKSLWYLPISPPSNQNLSSMVCIPIATIQLNVITRVATRYWLSTRSLTPLLASASTHSTEITPVIASAHLQKPRSKLATLLHSFLLLIRSTGRLGRINPTVQNFTSPHTDDTKSYRKKLIRVVVKMKVDE